MATPPPTTEMAVVFGLIGVAVVLFVTEALPPDVTAIGVLVSLVGLGRWTGVSPDEALAGFASQATLTIVAMYMLSDGIARAGLVRRLSGAVAGYVAGDPRRLLVATVGLTGSLAGVVNNTPVVAVFVPMVKDLADRTRVSPSKVLIPLSYAAMLGGTLTLVGTTTNLIASDLSRQLIGRPIGMFEFTPVGLLVLLVGAAYLLTVGQWLLPERVPPAIDLVAAFDLQDRLARVYVREESPLVGRTVSDVFVGWDIDLDVLEVARDGDTYIAPGTDQDIRAGDVLTIRANRATRRRFLERQNCWLLPWVELTEVDLHLPEGTGTLVEAVVPEESPLVGRTVAEAAIRDRLTATVLAVRRGGTVIHDGLPDVAFSEGDAVLLHTVQGTVDRLDETRELVVTETVGEAALERRPSKRDTTRPGKAPAALVIGIAVIGTAALGIAPIVVTALAGVVLMVATGVLRPAEAYGAVRLDVVFLLAGLIPLGFALEATGGAAYVAGLLVSGVATWPPVLVLLMLYLVTAFLTNLVSNNASVVLMVPVAVDAAARLDANAIAFVLGVAFAASTAFMTPIGYQTSLMVYGPGGYRFTDYARVGAPLQLLLAVVTTVGIAAFWGLRPG